MLVEERRQKVLDLVSEKGFVALTDLAQRLEASESTIRRDLDYWGQQGIVKRTHGGAIFLSDAAVLPALEERASAQVEEKRAIARAAAARIQDGDAVLLDGGTTTLEVARLLVGRPLQIVTNSLPIANLFASILPPVAGSERTREGPAFARSPVAGSERTREGPALQGQTDLVMLGGYIFPRTGVALGPLTIRMMEDLNVRQTILSVGGLTGKGLFNSNLLLVETERRMLRCADEVVVVADHTKIGRQALAFLCELADVDTLIVDSGLSQEQREGIERANVRLIVAGESTEGFQP